MPDQTPSPTPGVAPPGPDPPPRLSPLAYQSASGPASNPWRTGFKIVGIIFLIIIGFSVLVVGIAFGACALLR